MKIGIISEFNKKTVNYGNNLQAYAMNRFVRSLGEFEAVDTIYLAKTMRRHVTAPVRLFFRRAQNLLRNLSHGRIHGQTVLSEQVGARQEAFRSFQREHMHVLQEDMDWGKLQQTDYDVFIVGSDVVWAQNEYCVNRIKFLDFRAKKDFRKIAYAASFGENRIPKNNARYIKKCLDDFDAVSVREASAVPLLESVGVRGALHVLDPTLMITPEGWSSVERRPKGIGDGKYVFVYLLGTYASQRKAIADWARRQGLPIAFIPNAIGMKDDADKDFGDIKVTDCSPEEWVWLIHHAEHVITDSFHATVFSVNFGRHFFAMSREFTVDINVRMTDFLKTIGQGDKMVTEEDLLSQKEYEWDYEAIAPIIDKKRAESEKFLREALG